MSAPTGSESLLLRLPSALRAVATETAHAEGLTLNAFVAAAIAERIAAGGEQTAKLSAAGSGAENTAPAPNSEEPDT